jgi:hypothetical protein
MHNPNQCCGSGSGSTWIRIHLAVLNTDPDPYWECGSGSGSSSMKTDQNLQINLVFCLSKRLSYLHPLELMRIHNTDPNCFQTTKPGSTVVPSRFCTKGGGSIFSSLARTKGHIDKLREVEAGTTVLARLSWLLVLQHGECVLVNGGRSANQFCKSKIRKFADFNFF